MAFSTGIGDRGGLRSPREEQSSFAALGLTSPLRSTFGSHAANSSPGDVRGQLHRRFTTNNIPTLNTPLSPIGQQRRQAAEPAEFTTAVRSGALLFYTQSAWLHSESADIALVKPARTFNVYDNKCGSLQYLLPIMQSEYEPRLMNSITDLSQASGGKEKSHSPRFTVDCLLPSSARFFHVCQGCLINTLAPTLLRPPPSTFR